MVKVVSCLIQHCSSNHCDLPSLFTNCNIYHHIYDVFKIDSALNFSDFNNCFYPCLAIYYLWPVFYHYEYIAYLYHMNVHNSYHFNKIYISLCNLFCDKSLFRTISLFSSLFSLEIRIWICLKWRRLSLFRLNGAIKYHFFETCQFFKTKMTLSLDF